MSRPNKTKRTTAERKAQLQQLRELADRMELAWKTPAHGEMTDAEKLAITCALRDGYSIRNAGLIAAQRPTATDVSGFRKWLSRGRSVRKGETGIAIFAPIPERDEDGDKDGLRGVRVTHVFDIEQTDLVEERRP